MDDNKLTIEMPVFYLLQIAVYGNMGTGDLPDLMKTFSQRILRENGYGELLQKEQNRSLKRLREGIRNVLGDEKKKIKRFRTR